MRIDALPSQYEPFDEIDICTNRFIKGEIIFVIDDNVPLLVGYGRIPRIWLSIPVDRKGKRWQVIVSDNKSLHPKVKVNIKNKSVIIKTSEVVVLDVIKYSDNVAKIDFLDLRPFGINIYGNKVSLNVINNNFESNNFINTNIMIKIENKVNITTESENA